MIWYDVMCYQALCESVQQHNVLETVQLVLSGADVRYVTSPSFFVSVNSDNIVVAVVVRIVCI